MDPHPQTRRLCHSALLDVGEPMAAACVGIEQASGAASDQERECAEQALWAALHPCAAVRAQGWA